MANKKELNLPKFPLSVRHSSSGEEIFDIIRRQFVSLTPEEWVRQHCVHLLANFYPKELIAVEGKIEVNSMKKRFDILVYDKKLQPFMLVECKRPDVELTQKTIDQITAYNHAIQAPYLMLSNGMSTYLISYRNGAYDFIEQFPIYENETK